VLITILKLNEEISTSFEDSGDMAKTQIDSSVLRSTTQATKGAPGTFMTNVQCEDGCAASVSIEPAATGVKFVVWAMQLHRFNVLSSVRAVTGRYQ
jgi:hypothetical protein